MAQGQLRRDETTDKNAPDRGNASKQQLSVTGIMSPTAPPARTEDRGLTAAIARFGAVGEAIAKKRSDADFLSGQMAQMSGKTEADIAVTGNKTTMAGFVSLEVGNALNKWHSGQLTDAATKDYSTDPDAYARKLSQSAAELIATMGGDAYAEDKLAGGLNKSMQELAATQRTQHQAWLQDQTAMSFTAGLENAGNANSRTPDGLNAEGAPQVDGVRKQKDGYRAYAESVVDRTIGSESGNRATAKNPDSSAYGPSQFVDKTWIGLIRKHRKDLSDKSNAEILALRSNKKLDRQMNVEFTMQNAQGLSDRGLPVRPGTTHLAHFAGLGGATRVLRGDPNASVSTSLTPLQITSNRKMLTKRDGTLMTNREMIAWADKKNPGGPAQTPSLASLMANPGLSPEKHRQAITDALVTTLSDDNSGLYETVGGIENLSQFGLTSIQMRSIRTAHKALVTRRQNEYNGEYRRAVNDLAVKAASGDYTEDELFAQYAMVKQEFSKSPQEARRVHDLIQTSYNTKQTALAKTATDAAKLRADTVWEDPKMARAAMSLNEQLLNGDTTLAEATEAAQILGDNANATRAETNKAIGGLLATAASMADAARLAVTNEEKAKATAAIAKAKKENEAAAIGNLETPEMIYEISEIHDRMRGDPADPTTLTKEQGMAEMAELAKLVHATPSELAKALVNIVKVSAAADKAERDRIKKRLSEGKAERERREKGAAALQDGTAGTASPNVQAGAITVLRESIDKAIEVAKIPPEKQGAKRAYMMTRALVDNNLIDPRIAGQMRGGILHPLDADGKVTPNAAGSFDTYMDLKAAGAPPEYLVRMFKDDPASLIFLGNVEEALAGDAGSKEIAIASAAKRRDDPVTRAMITQRQDALATGAFVNSVVDVVTEASGLTDTVWNRVMNVFNADWGRDMLDEEERLRVLTDTGLIAIVDAETRSFAALNPQANMSTASQIIAGQVAERGSIMGASFVVAPQGTTMREVMGLNARDPEIANTAINKYVAENGLELFGEAVWDDIRPSLLTALISSENNTPRFTVQHVNGALIIQPTATAYAYKDNWIWDDNASNPSAQPALIPAKVVGAWYNKYQLNQDGLLGRAANSIVDTIR